MLLRTAKRARLWMAGLIVSIAVTILSGAPAFAAQTGEGSTWVPESAAGQPISSEYGFSEAYDDWGNVAQVWHDPDTNYIRVSYRNGGAAIWPGAVTQAAPRIIWTGYGFRVFHTGTDGNIYYAGFEIRDDGSLNLGTWNRVYTNYAETIDPHTPPTVVGTSNGGSNESWYLAYVNRNGYVYGQYHYRDTSNNYNTSWQLIAQGTGITRAPALAFNTAGWNRLVLTYVQGTDVWVTTQIYGSSTWGPALRIPGMLAGPGANPTIALTDNSNGQVAIRTGGGTIQIGHIWLDPYRVLYASSSSESTGWELPWDPWLTALHNTIFLIANADVNYNVYWKQSGDYNH